MSFRDTRKFIGVMKSLGYPCNISMDSFRTPNFELVAECLHWLILRYDPDVDMDTSIALEGQRVAFLTQATELMLSKARIKLNAKRLYSADGHAVKELLKVASLLQNATNVAANYKHNNTELGPSIKPFDVKTTRALVSEITKCGASLHDILESEAALEESRVRAITVNSNMDEIERELKESINTVLKSISSAEQDRENCKKDEEALKLKVEKRKAEIERNQNRLSTLQNVRPAYMDQYEPLQKELQSLFVIYSDKLRNSQWLQAQLEGHSQEEHEQLEEADRRMRRFQRKLHEEELSILRGEEIAMDPASTANSGGGLLGGGSSEEEIEGEESALCWKWFDRNSMNSSINLRAASRTPMTTMATPLSASTKGSKSVIQDWGSRAKDMTTVPISVKTIPDAELHGDVVNDFGIEEHRGRSSKTDSTAALPCSLDGSESSSVGLDECCDDELLAMEDIDPRGIGEDEEDSSDDNF